MILKRLVFYRNIYSYAHTSAQLWTVKVCAWTCIKQIDQNFLPLKCVKDINPCSIGSVHLLGNTPINLFLLKVVISLKVGFFHVFYYDLFH